MKTLLHQIIVLSILVINLHGTMQACVEGEPELGQPQPDLNITIFPSTTIREGDNVTIKCDAGTPRFPDQVAGAILLPKIIQIIVGSVTVTCKHPSYINTCDYVSSDFVKGRPTNVTCKAYNSAEACRVKSIEINVNEESANTTKRPFTGNMTITHVPGNMTTPVPGNMTTPVPTTASNGNTTKRPSTGNMTTHVPTTASKVSTKESTRITTSSSRSKTVNFAVIVSAIVAMVALIAVVTLALNPNK